MSGEPVVDGQRLGAHAHHVEIVVAHRPPRCSGVREDSRQPVRCSRVVTDLHAALGIHRIEDLTHTAMVVADDWRAEGEGLEHGSTEGLGTG